MSLRMTSKEAQALINVVTPIQNERKRQGLSPQEQEEFAAVEDALRKLSHEAKAQWKLGIEKGLNVDRFLEKTAHLFRSGEWTVIDNPIYKENYYDMMDSLEAGGYYNEPVREFGSGEASACLYKRGIKDGHKAIYPYIVSFDFNPVFDRELIFVEDEIQLLRLLNFLCPIINAGILTEDVLNQLEDTVKKERYIDSAFEEPFS